MTKEEYEKMLASDYWKGYSYSLIKERNFTCQDCGRSFPNERQKLNVHHLHYRDAKPWSYNPNELVVLCVECHQKRHGIVTSEDNNSQKKEKSLSSFFQTNHNKNWNKGKKWDFTPLQNRRNRHRKHSIIKSAAALLVLGVFVYMWLFLDPTKQQSDSKQPNQIVSLDKSNSQRHNSKIVKNEEQLLAKEETTSNNSLEEPTINNKENESSHSCESPIPDPTLQKDNNSSSELMRNKYHTTVVEQAKRMGVSTEGSTSEILDRISHKDAVEQAKRLGISTDGSTSEILNRIAEKKLEQR